MRVAGVGQWCPAVCEQRSEPSNPAVELERVCGVAAVSPRPAPAQPRAIIKLHCSSKGRCTKATNKPRHRTCGTARRLGGIPAHPP